MNKSQWLSDLELDIEDEREIRRADREEQAFQTFLFIASLACLAFVWWYA